MDTIFLLKITLPKGDVLEYTAKDMGHIKNEIKLFENKYATNKIKPKYNVSVSISGHIEIEKSTKPKINNKYNKIKGRKGIDFGKSSKPLPPEDLEDL